jgi:hypothetical protein
MTSSSLTPPLTRFSASHLADRPGDEVAAHRRDDAERAAMVAAFGNLEVRVVRRRQFYARAGNEVGIGIVRLRQVLMDRAHDGGGVVRTGDGEHRRVRLPNHAVLGAQASGDHHLAVLGERLADRIERLLDRGVDEAAGIDDDQVGAGVARGSGVALGAQLREDALGVDQRLGTTEGDEPDSRVTASFQDRSCLAVPRGSRGTKSR